MARAPWVLLSSRLPRDPSRLRLAIWRRLKRAGAVLLHDAVWILPADAGTREAFEWLAQEIEEQGGTAFVWEGTSVSAEQDGHIVERFRQEADARYAEIGATATAIGSARLRGRGIAQGLRQLRGLERALRLERRRDYFRAPGRVAAVAAVGEAVAALEAPPLTRERRVTRALGH